MRQVAKSVSQPQCHHGTSHTQNNDVCQVAGHRNLMPTDTAKRLRLVTQGCWGAFFLATTNGTNGTINPTPVSRSIRPIRVIRGQQKRHAEEKHEARNTQARRNDESEARRQQDWYREAVATHSEGLDAAGGLPWGRSSKDGIVGEI